MPRPVLNNMKPEIPISHTSNRFVPVIAAVIAVILILMVGLTLYNDNVNKQKSLSKPPKEAQTTTTSSQPPPQTEQIEGQAVSLKDNLLTLKATDGQEVQIKIAVGTSVIKQQWFDENSMGTVPAEVKAGDKISVQATKNSQGDKEAVSVVILVERSASQSAGKKQ